MITGRVHIAILFFLAFAIFSKSHAQELLYNFDEDIQHLSINQDGRLHILCNTKLCALEGNQLVDACLPVMEEASFVLPIRDDYMVVAADQILHFIKEDNHIHSDSFPEIITSLALADSLIYIGTGGTGLYKYQLKGFKKELIGFEHEFINDIACLGQKICLALDDGICVYDQTSGEINRKKLNDIFSFVVASDQQYFIGSTEQGRFIRIDLSGKIIHEYTSQDIHVKAMSSSMDKVFFTDAGACYYLNKELKPHEFCSGSYQTILALPNVLMLAEGGDLIFYDINGTEILTGSPVYSLFAENDEELWIGSEGEIQYWQRDSLALRIRIPTSIPKISVSALHVSHDMIIAGTLGDGLFIFNRTGRLMKHILAKEENNKNNIIQISAGKNLIWIAYLNGLLTLDASDFSLIKDYGELLGNNYLYCFYPLSPDEFYIGTSSKGLLKYAGETITYLLPKTSVLSITGKGDSIYIATETNGLYVFDRKTEPKFLAPIQNIQYLNVIGNDLIVGETKENTVLDLPDLSRFSIENSALKDIQLHAISQTPSDIIVGYSNGYLRMNRQSLEHLTRFGLHLNTPRLFNRKIGSDQHTFKYFEHSFSFSFHPNIYTGTKSIVYKYRLLGLDSSWQSTQQNKLNYYNLIPGNYEFQVDGSLNDNFIPSNIQSFSFEISKPFWARWWFILLIVVLLLFLLYLYIHFREKRIIQKQKQEQQRIIFEFEQLKNQIDPHFLFNSLNSLIGLIEEDPESAARSTEKLSQLYRNILKFEKIDLIPLEQELSLARDYFEIHKLRYEDLISMEIQAPAPPSVMIIPLSCQLLIENAIKHNIIDSQHPMKISIQFKNDFLIVRNTKKKKTITGNARSGIGIANLKARYNYLCDKAVIIEDEEHYFTVKIPLLHD